MLRNLLDNILTGSGGQLVSELLYLPDHVGKMLRKFQVEANTLLRKYYGNYSTYKLLLVIFRHHAKPAKNIGQSYIVVRHLTHHV
jgi:hypothetical protein